jgi:CheY-like chemotaxis protein
MSDNSEKRILIIDDQRDITRVLRTSLELAGKGYVITDVPSGEEAMLELPRKEWDMLVTDHRLPGMRGPELIQKARKRYPNIKAILITGSERSEVKAELGDTEVYGIFEKPIDMMLFVETVNEALFGKQEAAQALPSTSTIQFGDVPEIDLDTVRKVLSSLMSDLGANAIVFSDRTGKMLLSEGTLNQSLRFSELSVLLAFNFTTTAEIAVYLGDGTSSAVHYYDGTENDIYALAVGSHFFLTLVFGPQSQKQMGPVLRFGKAAVQELINAIGAEVVSTKLERPPLEEEKPEPKASKADKDKEAKHEKKKTGSLAKPKDPEPSNVKMDLDLDSLDADLATLDAKAGDLWDHNAIDGSAPLEDTISGEEAMELGLLSDEDKKK